MWFRSLFPISSRASRRASRWSPARGFRSLGLERLEDLCLPSFLAPFGYEVGPQPQAMVTGDFNNDTRLDLAIANHVGSWVEGSVSVLMGNADGTFQTARNSATGNFPMSLATGDFNADGNLDIVTANPGEEICVLLGNGDGTFQDPLRHIISTNPRSVSVGDFNSDGKLDLCVLSNWPDYYGALSYANVLLGTGTGTFSAPITSYLSSGFHYSAAFADFNNDEKLDIVSTTEFGTIDVSLGTGTGTFDYHEMLGNFTYWAGLSIIAADLNADGQVDLATSSNFYSGGFVSVFLGNGAGSFASNGSFNTDSNAGPLAAADFDGDGNTDLIMADVSTGTVGVLLGDGTGGFNPPAYTLAGQDPFGVVVGDFNLDGRPDAATFDTNANSVSVLINDGDWPGPGTPGVTINGTTVTEGNTGTTNSTFTVTLSIPSDQTVTVGYTSVDGTATAGIDYQTVSGVLTFAPGETSKTLTVSVIGDRVAEYNESFLLVLSNPTNAFLADIHGGCSIVDDEPFARIDYDPVSMTEGNSGTTEARFTVRLSSAYDIPVEVNYSTAEGDTHWWEWGYYEPPPAATAGSDFLGASGTVSFAPGETEKTISVAVIGDRIAEPDEYFSVDLTGSSLGDIDEWNGHAVGIIVDDEPRVWIDNATGIVEQNSGTTPMNFTVSLSAASDQPVTVSYATADQTATAGSDYQARSGTITFAPGETTKTITVPVNGDRLGESDEFFSVELTGVSGAIPVYTTAYGTIHDDEPRVDISGVSKVEGKKGQKTLFTFTVTLDRVYDQSVTMSFRTVDGTARAGSDYVAKTGTVTFAPGQTTKTITIEVKGDSTREPDEYFFVELYGLSSNALFWNANGDGWILNDDGRGR